jgi:UDP-N-acetylglucosamine 4-epimerase
MNDYEKLKESLAAHPRTWLVTGAAGFIGSNLAETLLGLGQKVTGLDNFSTGKRENLEQVREAVGEAWHNFRFIEGDIRDPGDCREACRSVERVLHQAALGSVPRSIEDPVASHDSNVTGFLNMLVAAREAGVRRFVYAGSSATYGDHPGLPKVEDEIGTALSPYAVTKHANELYASVFARCYGLETMGLRYFNVFGPRQDPDGAYAAVIPRWIAAMIRGEAVAIYGDGETARDFCYIDNTVQANLLAAMADDPAALNQVYNIAVNERTSLKQLFAILKGALLPGYPHLEGLQPEYREFRQGDVRLSLADIGKAERLLGYRPAWRAKDGLARTVAWYAQSIGRTEAAQPALA